MDELLKHLSEKVFEIPFIPNILMMLQSTSKGQIVFLQNLC
jgi:hypothetical protein